MTISVNCPQCSQTLVAPDELVGKLAACPGCSAQFPITNGATGSAATPPPPPPGPNQGGMQSQTESVNVASAMMPPPSPSASPVRTSSVADTSASPAAPSIQRAPIEAYAPPTKSSPKPAAPEHESQTPMPTKASQAAQPPTSPALRARAPVQRAAKAARFIAAASTDTAIQLGQDGQLPSLVLEEGRAKETDDESQKSSPYLLVAALCISLGGSVAMLLIDTEVQRSEGQDKPQARELIERHYISQPGQILSEPYQDELRAALQAHNQGDYATERRHYRDVIERLKAENNNELKGLTGQVRAAQPPNDEHLEKQLATLLRDD